MDNICFVSVAFGLRYIEQLNRLSESILEHHPESKHLKWENSIPINSKTFSESIYGFKVHAIQVAIEQGYKKVIWLDTACILLDRLDFYYYNINDYGVIAIEDTTLLGNVTSNGAFSYFGKTREKCIQDNERLVGGSIYVFDFNLQASNDIFQLWYDAEKRGVFGRQDDEASGFLQGHRHDETCMAHILYMNNTKPMPYEISKYDKADEAIIIKKHFK